MQEDDRRPLTSLGIVELDAVCHTSMVCRRFCYHTRRSSFLKRFTFFDTDPQRGAANGGERIEPPSASTRLRLGPS